MIGNRIKQARAAAGMSLRQLADEVDMSAMAISKYERGEITPSSDVLLRLAKPLSVRVEYFFRQTEIKLEEIDYRKHKQLPAREEHRVQAEVIEHLERWVDLESIIPSSWPDQFKLPDTLPDRITSLNDVETCAKLLREAWNLGSAPIGDLIEELEEENIKVVLISYDAEKRFDGLSLKLDDCPVIVISSDWPGDRQRFTAAHELGHLVVKGRLPDELSEDQIEKYCDRFAGAFLVPESEAIASLGKSRTRLEPQELYLLKHGWGLSMAGWLHRAQDLEIINKNTAGKLWGMFTKRGWRKLEPWDAYPGENPRRFRQYIFRALAEELIGESRAAELLAIPISDLRHHRKMTTRHEASHH